MTQQLGALLFPETSPQPGEFWPLALVFDQIAHYGLPGNLSPAEAVDSGFFRKLEPIGLPEGDLVRFLAMSSELKGNEAEFCRGMLASLSGVDFQEDSVQSLAESLRSDLAGHAPGNGKGKGLWQALLLLKLAEMLREQEREIACEFMAVSRLEAGVVAAIRGESEELDEEEKVALRRLTGPAAPRGFVPNQVMLTRAWSRLYLDDPEAGAFPVLATVDPECASLLAEAGERLSGQGPQEIARLILPSGSANERLAVVENFRDRAGEARGKFALALLSFAAGEAGRPALDEAAQGLNLALASSRQGEEGLGKTLVFYACHGLSLSDLVAGFNGKSLRPAGKKGCGLFALLA